jgi:thiol-disulfide isomerase/thioredoxin
MPMRSWQPLSEFDFHHTLMAQQGVALVLFGQPGCGACRVAKQRLPELLPAEVATLFEVDVAQSTALANEFELFHLPALVLYRDGEFHAWLDAPLERAALSATVEQALNEPAQETP